MQPTPHSLLRRHASMRPHLAAAAAGAREEGRSTGQGTAEHGLTAMRGNEAGRAGLMTP